MMRRILFAVAILVLAILNSCSAPKQTAPAEPEVQSEGEGLYLDYCADCHEMSNPELHKQPPKLHGLFLRPTLPSGAPATDEQVRKTIVEGRGTMPAFDQRLRKDEVNALLKYLHGLN